MKKKSPIKLTIDKKRQLKIALIKWHKT